jgi:hypothetical protein
LEKKIRAFDSTIAAIEAEKGSYVFKKNSIFSTKIGKICSGHIEALTLGACGEQLFLFGTMNI